MVMTNTGRKLHLEPIGLRQIIQANRENQRDSISTFSRPHQTPEQVQINYAHFANLFSGTYEIIYDSAGEGGFKPILKPTEFNSRPDIRGRLIFPREFGGNGSYFSPDRTSWHLAEDGNPLLFCELTSKEGMTPARIYAGSNKILLHNAYLSNKKNQDIRKRYSFRLFDFSVEQDERGMWTLQKWED
jgi:hypothetical protein